MSFTDFIRLQNDGAQALLGDTDLANVNIVTRHRLVQDGSRMPDQTLAAEVLAYTTPRGGRQGLGIIVEIPEVSVEHPNLPGPECFIIQTFLILEDRVQNLGPTTGTLKPADQAGQRILELMHGLNVEGVGQWFAERNAMQAAPDFEPLDAFRVRLKLRLQRDQSERCANPAITEATGTITLDTTDDGVIWYTTDGSYPAPGNIQAKQFSAPFQADVGTVIRWAAYSPLRPQSHVGKATVT